MKAILETKNLVKYYGTGENLVKAIDHTDIRIEPGEFVAVVGRSGSGKSTLLHMLGGLDRPDSGKVLIEGRDIFRLKDERLAVFRRRKIGFIFQSYNLVPSLNVWENIVLPIGLDGRKVDQEYVMDIIRRIGWKTGCTHFRILCPAGSSKEWLLQERWLHVRRSFWPMSPRVTWIPGQRSRW